MKTLGAHGRHWHDWGCQRHVNGCHVYPMRRHLIAVFVVTRFVVDVVAVIVVVTLVPLVRFVIMVVIYLGAQICGLGFARRSVVEPSRARVPATYA